MKKYIHTTKETRKFLMQAFDVTERTVFNALMFDPTRGSSDKAQRIRKLALMHGGIMMNKLEELETLHDADGYMRQYLPNDVLIEFGKTKETKGCNVYHRGKLVRQYDDFMASEIGDIQRWAAGLR